MGWASEDELTGLGMSPQLAVLIGDNPGVLAGKGTTQTGATPFLGNLEEVTATGGQTAFVLTHYELNTPVFVTCTSSTSAVVFCPSGATLNGSSNGSLTIAQNKSAIFWEYKKGFWASVLSNV
jgi:hypothetical protein